MRQIALDTETTGLSPEQGHRIIEIGAVELIDRRLTGNHYQQYINPQRAIDKEAYKVHGLSKQFLSDKPVFVDISQTFIEFIEGAELIIHNAPFDIGFLNHELKLSSSARGKIEKFCTVFDTLILARRLHPGQKNTLDALCKRYKVDNSKRDLHGALLDTQILAQVYLAMTGGQESLFNEKNKKIQKKQTNHKGIEKATTIHQDLPIIKANADEITAHQTYMEVLREKES